MSHARVALLISGGGSNMVALVRSMYGTHPARPVLVVSNRADAGGLSLAANLGVPTAVLDHRGFGGDRAAFEAALMAVIDSARPPAGARGRTEQEPGKAAGDAAGATSAPRAAEPSPLVTRSELVVLASR